jgi:preprotein translocase subunit SecB
VNTPTPAQQPPQTAQIQQPIAIQAQYVKDLSFENPGAPMALAGQTQPPQIAINLDLDGRQMGERQFEVLLKINAKATLNDQTIFLIELTYGAVCQIADQVPKEQVGAIAMIEGARQIFPFARSVLANASRDGGYPPLLMNPVNFIAFYQQMLARQQAQAQAAAPAAADDDGSKLN